MDDNGHGARDRITMRLPQDLLEEIERIAASELTPTTILLRRWINERVALERQRRRDAGE